MSHFLLRLIFQCELVKAAVEICIKRKFEINYFTNNWRITALIGRAQNQDFAIKINKDINLDQERWLCDHTQHASRYHYCGRSPGAGLRGPRPVRPPRMARPQCHCPSIWMEVGWCGPRVRGLPGAQPLCRNPGAYSHFFQFWFFNLKINKNIKNK